MQIQRNLPSPLTSEEENLVYQNFDQIENKNLLAEKNLRLVMYVLRKFENTGIDKDELFAIGSVGLLKAVNTFDPSRNFKFATYASRCIHNEILMTLRKNKKNRLDISINEELSKDQDGNSLIIEDILPHEDKYDWMDSEFLHIVLSSLSEKERHIIQMRFFDELSQKEISKILGLSQSYISRIENGILRKLRKEAKKIMTV